MSFLAKMHIDDQEYNVLSCTFSVKQDLDLRHRPCGAPVLGVIRVSIESSKKTNFFGWSISPDELRDGEIIFFKHDLMSSFTTLSFKKAYCVEYEEEYNAFNDQPMVTHIVLSCYALTVNGLDYVNTWELS